MHVHAFCFAIGVSVQSEFNLIIAAVQLKEIQTLIAAVRAGDVPPLKQLGPVGIALDTYQPSSDQPRSCDTVYTGRRVIHPEPRYEPRPVIHPEPKVECLPPISALCKSGENKLHIGPPPIWDTLPWPVTTPIDLRIKLVPTQPDTNHRGTLIDLFV
jgi:hypothetical protein